MSDNIASVKIYHNPRCKSSVQALTILQELKLQHAVKEYLVEGLVNEEIIHILQILGCNPQEIVRKGEAVYIENNLGSVGDEMLIEFMVRNPILLERPIALVTYRDGTERGIIARPGTRVLEIL